MSSSFLFSNKDKVISLHFFFNLVKVLLNCVIYHFKANNILLNTTSLLNIIGVDKNLANSWVIDVSMKSICHIDTSLFSFLKNLILIDLSDNQIDSIDEPTFKGLKNVRYLNLGNNKLSQLSPKTFSDLINLSHLFLSDNLLKRIEPGTFSTLTNLQELRLLNNHISLLDSTLFRGLVKLRNINLGKQKLQSVQKGIQTNCFYFSRFQQYYCDPARYI